MDLNESLKIEIGDTLIADYCNGIFNKGDEVIVIEKSPFYEQCTEGWFYNKTQDKTHGGNVQSFSIKINQMKLWVTEIQAIDPVSGVLKTWCGPEVPGLTISDAENYCNKNGLGYCKIIGELIAEIPCKPGTYQPDFENMVDYDKIKNN